MNGILSHIGLELFELLGAVIVALVGFATRSVINFLNNRGIVAKIEGNKEIVKIIVEGVEQAYDHLNGNERLDKAKLKAVNIFRDKGIKISEEEIDSLIESAVREMNEEIYKIRKQYE